MIDSVSPNDINFKTNQELISHLLKRQMAKGESFLGVSPVNKRDELYIAFNGSDAQVGTMILVVTRMVNERNPRFAEALVKHILENL